MHQIEVLLGRIYNSNKRALEVMKGLKPKPAGTGVFTVGEAGRILFPESFLTEPLCCFLTLVACGEETVSIILGELERRELTPEKVLPEIVSVIEEECRRAKEKLARVSLERVEGGIRKRGKEILAA